MPGDAVTEAIVRHLSYAAMPAACVQNPRGGWEHRLGMGRVSAHVGYGGVAAPGPRVPTDAVLSPQAQLVPSCAPP
jgi:hypothetical protein